VMYHGMSLTVLYV